MNKLRLLKEYRVSTVLDVSVNILIRKTRSKNKLNIEYKAAQRVDRNAIGYTSSNHFV